MKQELDRVKSDVETMQRAMGLPPASGREWIPWMKRDSWFSLWWCLPGLIIITAAFLPAERYLGLVTEQWGGILTAIALLGMLVVHFRRETRRPKRMVQEWKRAYGKSAGGRMALIFTVPWVLYFIWGAHYRIGANPFWAGLISLLGCVCLVTALAARAWGLLGVAIPFLAYGLCFQLAEVNHAVNHKVNGVLFGMMFIAMGLLSSIIQVWQIRQIERQNEMIPNESH